MDNLIPVNYDTEEPTVSQGIYTKHLRLIKDSQLGLNQIHKDS